MSKSSYSRSMAKNLLLLSFILSLSTGILNAQEEEPSLTFFISKNKKAEFSLSKLKAKLKSHPVRLEPSPFAINGEDGKTKNYEGFAVKDVLDLVFGAAWRDPKYTGLVFEALDGYQSAAEAPKLLQDGGYIVYKDLDVKEGWDLVGYKKRNPRPFYLVWTGKDQNTANAFPWPWALAAIHLVEFEQHYPKVVPQGVKKDSPEWRGFQVFKAQCFRCHAIDKQGGAIGPDLGAPKVITEYREAGQLKDFIKKPSLYRHTSMPDHEHLSDQDLEDLIAYFKSKEKKK